VVPMRKVTWVNGSFRAHVLAARFASEGIDVQLRGALDSQYALTVGSMARIDVWVPEDQVRDAEYLLLSSEVDDAMAAPASWGGSRSARRPWVRWSALLLLAAALVLPVISQLTAR
jgi:hypothetical protein